MAQRHPKYLNNLKFKKEEIQVFIISFVLLFLETAFFHILMFTHNYLDAISIISYALIGLAIGSLITYFIKEYYEFTFYLLVLFLIVSIILAFTNIVRFPVKIFLSPFMILPFLLGSITITFFFKKKNSNRIYFFDLLGGTFGVFISIILIPLLKTENALILCIGLLSIIGLFYRGKRFKKAIKAFFIFILVSSQLLIIFNMLTSSLELEKITKCYNDSPPYKIFCLWDNTSADYQPILSKDNLVSRISVYKRTIKDEKSTIFVNYDGYPEDRITSLDAASWKNDLRIPFMFTKNEKEYRLFKEDPNVLIIGTAAQGIVKPIKHLTRNYSLIKGLEINPGIVSIMENEFFEYSGRAYEDISIDIIDARTFLKNTEDKYNLITLLNTYKTRSIGSIGEPDFLHTTDVIRDYFNHLTDDGFLLLEERTINERAKFAVLRLINNFYTVLKEDGYKNPQNHFFIYNWKPSQKETNNDWYTMIVIKKTPLTRQDINYFNTWLNYQYEREYILEVSSKHTQLEYLPGRNLDTEYANFINSDDKNNFFGSNIILSPNTDDSPYIFAVYKEQSEIKKILYSIGALCLIIFIISLIFLGKTLKRKQYKYGLNFIAYFSLIGLGYLIIEIGLMKIYQNYMGSPTYSFIFILGTLLFSSGVGGYVSKKYSDRLLKYAFIGILLFSLYHLFINKYLLEMISGGPLFNSSVIALTVFPLGYCMGIPFPNGLEKVKGSISKKYTTIFFSINSIFSTFAVVLGLYLSISFGFIITFSVGIICYFIATILFYIYTK